MQSWVFNRNAQDLSHDFAGSHDGLRCIVKGKFIAFPRLDRCGGFHGAMILDGGAVGLLDDGFVYGMVVQHEHQHGETMLATIQLSGVSTDAAGTAR